MIPDRVGWFRDIVTDIAQEFQVPVELAVVAAMGIIALAATGAYELQVKKGYKVSTTLIFLGLVPSGIGKTPLLNRLREPLDHWIYCEGRQLTKSVLAYRRHFEMLAKKRSSHIALLAKPATAKGPMINHQDIEKILEEIDIELAGYRETIDPLTITSDVTPHGIAGLLAMSPEGRVGLLSAEGEIVENLLGRYGRSAIEIVCKAIDSDPIRLDRRKGNPVDIPRPLLAGTVLTQPGVGLALVTDDFALEKGLAARFLPVLPPLLVGERMLCDASQDGPSLNWSSTVQRLLNADRPGKIVNTGNKIAFSDELPMLINLTPDAAHEFATFWAAWEQRLRPGGDLCSWSSWGNKMRGIVAKIALVLHVLHHYPVDDVSLETMQAAIRWADYLVDNLRALSDQGQQPEIKKSIDWIKRNGQATFTQRDMFNDLRRARTGTMDSWDPIFVRLVKAGYIRLMPQIERGKGRPSVVYEVNPLALE